MGSGGLRYRSRGREGNSVGDGQCLPALGCIRAVSYTKLPCPPLSLAGGLHSRILTPQQGGEGKDQMMGRGLRVSRPPAQVLLKG